jgi:hypothetical protein
MTMTTERGTAPSTASPRHRAGAAVASEAPKKIKVPRDQDPRNPIPVLWS